MTPTLRPGRPSPLLRPARSPGLGPGFRLGLALVVALVAAPAAVLAGAVSRDDDPVELQKREVARLQGVWTLQSMEFDGEKVGEERTRGWILVIRGDQYNPGSDEESVEYTYFIDPERNPKAIDLVPHEGNHKGQRLRGIYAVKGDLLTICRARTPEGERPAGFTTRPDSGLVVSVWKRRKR